MACAVLSLPPCYSLRSARESNCSLVQHGPTHYLMACGKTGSDTGGCQPPRTHKARDALMKPSS